MYSASGLKPLRATVQSRNNMCSLCVLLCLLLHITFCFNVVRGSRVGVCYGALGNNLPSPWEGVQLYKQNNIDKMRIYSPGDVILGPLRNSGIEIMMGVPDQELELLSNSPQAAREWVYRNVRKYYPAVNFKYIAVGNERIPSTREAPFVLGAMKNIHTALTAENLQGQIKVSTPVHDVVLRDFYAPSDGAFKREALQYMVPIVQFLQQTGSPLLFNAYPYFSYVKPGASIPLNYALFRGGGPGPYESLFAAMVDAMYTALEKVGGGNVEVVVSETGWPSAGGPAATWDNAGSYNWNVINHVGDGTPKRPGKPVKTYLFAMFNENQKPGPETERHFGLFYPNKNPVYPLRF